MKREQPERKTFSKEEIFSALDSILESSPLDLCGVMSEMPVEFDITHDTAWELLAEWTDMAIRRYRKRVDS
ncbi:MAG: hypothetical protein P8123_05975 [bacterium]|jgi:hypothetical protein